MRLFVAVFLSWIASGTLPAQNYTVSTFAGGALPVNMAGTSANLGGGWVLQTAVDPAGNLYFPYQNTVLKWNANSGLVTLFAGNGTAGFSGDNGPATSAQLNSVTGVALDSQGNIYIADTSNLRVREVSNGVITTVAGNGQAGYSGHNGDGGLATSGMLANPRFLVVDSAGNLYIADATESVVRKVANGVITTVAGNWTRGFTGDNGQATTAELNIPLGVALDSAGNLYIADSGNHRIRKVAGGIITTVAGNGTGGYTGDSGPAALAEINGPVGIAFDAAGGLFIGDSGNNVIRKITSGVITTVAGNGSPGFSGDNGAPLSAGMSPTAITVDSANGIFVSDSANRRIRKIGSGTIATLVGGGPFGNGSAATAAQFGAPAAVALGPNGDVYVADSGRAIIWKVSGGVITVVAGNGGQGSTGDGGPATSAQIGLPLGVAADTVGNLYILDYNDCNVRKVSSGVISTVAGIGCGYSGDNGPAVNARLGYPRGIAVDPAGSLYIADYSNSVIRKVTNGVITTVAGNGLSGYGGDYGPAASAQLASPYGVGVDASGNLYIADTGNSRIRKVTNGTITTIAGYSAGFSGDNGPATAAQLNNPIAVTAGSAGDLYIVDSGNQRVRSIVNGTIATIAGGGVLWGDSGPATSVQLAAPAGVAAATPGNVYVAETGALRVRLLSSLAPGLTVVKSHAGNFPPGQNGATYTIVVSNALAAGTTSGAVTVADTLPSGLTLVSMSGTGWNCSGSSCTRNDVLEPGSSYPAITVTVNVAADAPSQVTNQVTVSGGGSANANASDVTTIAAGQPPAAVTGFSPGQGATGVAVTTSLTWTPPSGATSYAIYFGTSTPPPLVASSLTNATYSPAMTAGTTYYWSVTAANAYGSTQSAVWSFTTTGTASGYRFVPVTPCRVLDTRNANGTFGGPIMAAGSTRTVPVPQSICNIPSTAQAYSLNITVVPPGPLAYLTAWPAGQTQPVVSTLNSYDGRIVANAAIVPAGASQAIEFYASDATHVIADINGYFAPLSTANSMSFYAVTPCRVVDTRNGSGAFGGPSLGGGSTRSFAIPSSACGIPSTAQAYSLNVTVVPHAGLGYLTMWPTGQAQPYVSTLNSPDGSVVANAAIVPAGTSNGSVSVFVTDATDVIIDINGYFAPPGSANALSLYTLTPCRVADTRQPTGAFGGPSLGAGGTRSFALASSACGVPTAPAYSLNVTVVPAGSLAYLTAWPTGQTQPTVSTLNSYAGKVVANAAIVPAGANGGVSIFVSDATNVILDINAYFAQ